MSFIKTSDGKILNIFSKKELEDEELEDAQNKKDSIKEGYLTILEELKKKNAKKG